MNDLKPFIALYKQQWRRLALGSFLAIVTLAASIGLLSVSGWFLSATAVAGLVIARSADFNYLMPAGAVRGLSVVRTVSRWAERVITHDATFRLLSTLRSWFFLRLGEQADHKLATTRQGDLLNRMVADIDALDHVYLRLITPLVSAIVTAIGGCVLVGYFAPIAGLALATVMATLIIGLPLIFYRLGKAPGKRIASESLQLRQQLLDYFVGHTELRLFAALPAKLNLINRSQTQLVQQQRTMANLAGFAQGLVVTFNGWTLLLVLIVGYQVMAADGTVGPLLALIGFATMASFEAIAPLAGAFQHLSHVRVAAGRLNQVLDGQQQSYGEVCDLKAKSLSFKQVSFSYPTSTQPVLANIDLTVKQGEKLAIVGQTGCGKSTLLQLLTRQLEPSSGTIEIDGTPLAQYQQGTLRQLFSVVSQRVHIFNDTLGNNLRLACSEATEARLVEVLNQVQLQYLITDGGLEQWVGDGGRALSGGEKRRIGIARALLHGAPIVLLDEPTEGLDQQTEQAVITTLFEQLQDRTLIYVTHKPAALSAMDRCVKMEFGQLKPHQ